MGASPSSTSDALLMPNVACIVEGFGETEAVPILIRRIGEALDPPVYPGILKPIRHPKSALVHRAGILEKAVELAAESAGKQGGIFIIMDSDEDCPMHLGQQLLARARAARSDMPIAAVIAKWEYEAWFLAAATSLRGKRGLSADLQPPLEPESVQDAKGWLSRHMPAGNYSETRDQAALTQLFDMQVAQTARSFRKCYKEITALLTLLRDKE